MHARFGDGFEDVNATTAKHRKLASDPGNTYDRGYAASREQAMTDFKARLHAHRMPQILAA